MPLKPISSEESGQLIDANSKGEARAEALLTTSSFKKWVLGALVIVGIITAAGGIYVLASHGALPHGVGTIPHYNWIGSGAFVLGIITAAGGKIYLVRSKKAEGKEWPEATKPPSNWEEAIAQSLQEQKKGVITLLCKGGFRQIREINESGKLKAWSGRYNKDIEQEKKFVETIAAAHGYMNAKEALDDRFLEKMKKEGLDVYDWVE